MARKISKSLLAKLKKLKKVYGETPLAVKIGVYTYCAGNAPAEKYERAINNLYDEFVKNKNRGE